MRQDVRRRGEAAEAHDKGAPEGETVPMRSVRQVLQDGGIPQDPPEAAQQTFHLRHMRHLEGLRLRSAPAQEEAQSGVRDALRDLQEGLLHESNAGTASTHAHRREAVRLQGVQHTVRERGVSQHARKVARRAGEAQVQHLQLRELLEGRAEGAPQDTHRRESDHLRALRQIRQQQDVPADTHAHTLGREAARLRDVRQGIQRKEVPDCSPADAYRRETVRV